MTEIWELSAADAHAAMTTGKLSTSDYVGALVERCRQYSWLNAFIVIDDKGAMEAARAADQSLARGDPPGPLFGLPIAVKDSIDVAGFPTTANTPALKQNRASHTATVVQRAIDAGAIFLGKANMHELGGGTADPPESGRAALNPYNPRMMTTGSSSGTAAALGARLVPLGLGTDTGGSVRKPAVMCGGVGMRPTIGTYPSEGSIPSSPTRSTIGPMARTVADMVRLHGVITGTEHILAPAPLRGVRAGIPRRYFWANVDSQVEQVIEKELDRLSAAGMSLVEVDIEDLEELDRACLFPVARYESRQHLTRYLADRLGLTYAQLVEQVSTPQTKAMLSAAVDPEVLEAEYREAIEVHLPRLRAAYEHCFQANGIEVLIYPTTLIPPRPVEDQDTTTLNGSSVPTFPTLLHNTSPASAAGIPGASIAAGLTDDGLPVGINFDGPMGADKRLLEICLGYEGIKDPLPPPNLEQPQSTAA